MKFIFVVRIIRVSAILASTGDPIEPRALAARLAMPGENDPYRG